MKRRYFFAAALVAVLLITIIGVYQVVSAPLSDSIQSQSDYLAQAGKPTGGWFVCQDLGVGEVPDVGEPRARFRLCHNGGWAVDTYCLNPEMQLPQLEDQCRLENEDVYFCGEGVQLLKVFILQVTPTATETATVTLTNTSTSTSTETETPTLTLTPTVTETPTATGTFTSTPTNTETATPTSTSTSTATSTETQTPTITPTPTVTSTGTQPPTSTSTSTATLTQTGTQPPTGTSTTTVTPTGTTAASWTPLPTWTATGTSTITPTSPTNTSIPTITAPISSQATATGSPAPSATPRPQPGGFGYRDIISIFLSWLGVFGESDDGRAANWTPSPTPFQPLTHPASNWIGESGRQPPLNFYGIDFSPGALPVRIRIDPADPNINHGKPIMFEFTPEKNCQFGDGNACASTFPGVLSGQTIFITIHSGIGGEGQEFRDAIEGTGFDRAGLPLEKITNRMLKLQDAEVTIFQGTKVILGLNLSATSRIPATAIREYFSLPIPDAIGLAGELDQSLLPYLYPERPQIIFETCGWKVPSESGAKEVSDTTGSVYLGVIRE